MTPFDPRLPLIAADARVKTCHVFHCWCALKDMGKSFHADAFASFAGLEPHHVSAILSAIEAHGAVPAGRITSTRGHRLAADFAVPEDWIEWASTERGWAPDDARAEAANFVDFWHAKSGAGAAKLDWRATWRNWVRNSRRPNGDYRPTVVPTASYVERARAAADLYERMGRTVEAQEIRDKLAQQPNVIPFTQAERKIA